MTDSLSPHPGSTPLEQFPIPLSDDQQAAVKEWAADDRLWTTQETVEFNLRTFARLILKSAGDAARARVGPMVRE